MIVSLHGKPGNIPGREWLIQGVDSLVVPLTVGGIMIEYDHELTEYRVLHLQPGIHPECVLSVIEEA